MYNQTYIDILLDITQKLADRGIYVILDMHQVIIIKFVQRHLGINAMTLCY